MSVSEIRTKIERIAATQKRKFLCLPASVFTDLSAMTTPSVLDDSGGGVEIEPILAQYAAHLQKMETLRKVDELRLLEFAKHLKDRGGQKYVSLF